MKSLSARRIFQEFLIVKCELWEGDYFARTLGDKVTINPARKYIWYH
ncbi:MAG: transposase [Blastocatellia bacterium]|nr:transposase [Blastocatellia bacterium]